MEEPGNVKARATDTQTSTGTERSPHPLPEEGSHTPSEGTLSLRPDEKPDWAIGDVVDGKYEVMEIIGRGGMGLVYKVRHREWDIDLAVKMPLPHVVADEVSKARFIREAQTWVDLGSHPNIVQCWYVRELGGVPRLFMDYLPGGSLKQWIRDGKIKPGAWDAILDLSIQACDGLGHAHGRGVVHRDVQPANMLMSGDGRLCLSDFGLVKIDDAQELDDGDEPPPMDSGLTITGSTMGTPQYGAPEQWGEARHADARADIYALGVTLFELASGRRPFDDGSHSEPPHVLIARHLAVPAPDPRKFNAEIPITLAKLILSCLAKDPDRRPQTMASLRAVLAQIYARILGRPYVRPVPQVEQARADALNNRGVSLHDLGKKEEALTVWREATRLDACHPEALYNLSLQDWRDGRIGDLEAIRPLMEIRRTHPQAGFYLGLLHLERMAADEAEEAIVGALEHADASWSGSARRALGDAFMAQQKFADAYAAYTKALLILPGDVASTEGLALASKRTRQRDGEPLYSWRRLIATLELPTSPVNALAAAPGKGLIVAAGEGGNADLAVWDLDGRQRLRSLVGHAGAVRTAAATADGARAVTAGDDGTLRLWNLESGTGIRVLAGHAGAVRAVAIAPDGRRALSAGDDGIVRLWDLESGAVVRVFAGHAGAVRAVAIAPDGRRALSAGEDHALRHWDIESGVCHGVIEGHTDGITALVLLPGGAIALTGSADRTLRLWDVGAGRCLHILAGHTDVVTTVAASPDGRHALSGSTDRTLRLWDLSAARCLRTYGGHSGALSAIAMSPDGRGASSGGADRSVCLWDLGEEVSRPAGSFMVCRIGTPALAQVWGRRFRKTLAAANQSLVSGDCRAAHAQLTMARLVKGYERDPEALTLNAKLSAHLPRKAIHASWFSRALVGHGDGITAAVVTPSGDSIVSGSFDDTLRVWDITTGHCRKILGGAGWVLALVLSPDGRTAFSRSETHLHEWDLETGTRRRSFPVGVHAGKALALSPGGRYILSWCESRAGKLALGRWELATGKAFRSSDPTPCGFVESFAVTPDGRVGVAGSVNRTLYVWDLTLSRCIRTLKSHRRGVTAIAVTPDGRMALSGSADRTVRLWDIEAGRSLRTYEGHEAAVTAVAITSDGGFAFSGSADRSIRLWDLADGQCLKVFEGHTAEVNAVAVTPDGRFVVSGSDDKTLRLWELEWELDPDGTSQSLAEVFQLP